MVMMERRREHYGEKAVGCLFLYSQRADLECFKLCSGSHESSSVENSFHLIRKERWEGGLRWRRIFSISYSSSPSIRSGGGFRKFSL